MRTLRAWALRLRGVVRRAEDEREFADELEADLERHTEDGIRAGMSREDARRAAILKLGGMAAATEAWRDRHGIPWLETSARDVMHALRILRRNRAWTAVAVVSLALGVGATTAVFSAVNGVFLKTLPVPAAGELVTLRWQGENRAITNFTDYGFVADGGLAALLSEGEEFSFDNMRAGVTGAYETFRRLEAANDTLHPLFAFANGPTVNVIVDGQGDIASSFFVSGEFYNALRIPPAAGRPILPSDDQRGAAPVAVISDGYWERRFGRDPAIVGKQVRINAVTFTIAGVSAAALPNLITPQNSVPDVAIPISMEPAFHAGQSRLDQPTAWWLVMMGRLKPGLDAAQVEADLAPVYEQATRDAAETFLGTLTPEDREDAIAYGLGQRIPRLHVVSGARGAYDTMPMHLAPLTVLGALVGIVLLVVCANLANLSLALATTRAREIAVRRALGATRLRLVRQVLTEHAVLAVMGGTASLLVAYLLQDLIRLSLPVAFDWAVVAFAFVAAMTAGLASGMLPALRASRSAERAPAGGDAIPARSRLTSALLVAQVAMSLVLLVGAGLFVRTLVNLQNVDPGFDMDNLVIFGMEPGFNQYDEERTEALYRALVADLRAVPGIASAAFSAHSPLSGNRSIGGTVAAEGADPGTVRPAAYTLIVHQDFFETMGIPIRAGRTFTERDNKDATPVAVINQSLATALFGDASAIGRRFSLGIDEDLELATMLEVVGVVADTRHATLRESPPRIVYRPHLQSGSGPRTFEVRTTLPPEDVMPAIRQVVQAHDPALPLLAFSTQLAAVANHWSQERIVAIASGALGALALAISVIGLVGVMSYAVARRTKDIGIRMALGADRGHVLRSVLREALVLAGAGILIGLAAALATTRFLETMLFGLSPNDPAVIAGAIALMLGVAAASGYVPARRAARVDPLVALRHE